MWYIIIKTIDGKKHYLSTTGKWVKSRPMMALFPNIEVARLKAKMVGGAAQPK